METRGSAKKASPKKDANKDTASHSATGKGAEGEEQGSPSGSGGGGGKDNGSDESAVVINPEDKPTPEQVERWKEFWSRQLVNLWEQGPKGWRNKAKRVFDTAF